MSVAEQNLTDRITYEDLYKRWEQNNWSAMALDFEADREGWASLTEMQRKSAMWVYSMFFFGEDSVADNLSPYIDAAPREDQKYFLATQQVDEARHAVFFHRFFKEVIEAGDSIASTLAFTEQHLSWGYRQVFDRLDRMAEELRRDRSLPKFAQAITLYHLIVEATLAQPGQHFIEDFFIKDGSMPAFSEGMKNVSRDEQRHIGFGVKVLSELIRESDECKAAIDELLTEVMPWTSSVFIPPGWDLEYTRCFGFEIEDIAEWGIQALEQKWRAIGYPMDEMPPGVIPMDFSLPHRERAEQTLKLVQAGVIGEPLPPDRVDSSPAVQKLYFDVIARSLDSGAVNGEPFSVQWKFTDAEPWHVVVDNGSTRAERGVNPAAQVTLESDWHDFIDLGKGAVSPPKALVQRKLKVHGGPRNLLRFRKLFG
ncbi:MAG TPA: ribonucleotide-diphosphate reductase subunit beta [Solirubrobacterales bacterium]|nr:ribonucleotide-diphosphate reductase subunit beta [Solirubrobacterales bacterium]